MAATYWFSKIPTHGVCASHLKLRDAKTKFIQERCLNLTQILTQILWELQKTANISRRTVYSKSQFFMHIWCTQIKFHSDFDILLKRWKKELHVGFHVCSYFFCLEFFVPLENWDATTKPSVCGVNALTHCSTAAAFVVMTSFLNWFLSYECHQ